MKQPLPTLSSEGIITSPERALLYLFKSFLAIDKNVSNYWRNDAHSFMHLRQKYGKDIEGLSNAINDALHDLFSNYFDKSTINVDFESANELIPLEDATEINLKISVLVEDGNNIIPLTTVLQNAWLDNDDVFGRLIFKHEVS